MTKVVSYVFNSLFERKETISYQEKRTVVVVFVSISIATALILISI